MVEVAVVVVAVVDVLTADRIGASVLMALNAVDANIDEYENG